MMLEIAMNKWKVIDRRYEAIAWGTGFVCVGVLSLIPGEQNGIGVLSIGLILLGLNAARFLSQIPQDGFTTVIGVLASILGLVVLLSPALHLPHLELDLIPLLLIVVGLYFLVPDSKRVKNG